MERAVVLLGAACVLIGLVAWSGYEHAPASSRAPALALFVPPVSVPGLQKAPVALPSALTPMSLPGVQEAAAPAAPMVQPSAVMPMTMDSPGVLMPIEQLSMDTTSQSVPLASGPSEASVFMGLSGFFWGLAGTFAIGVVMVMKQINDGQKSGSTVTTLLNDAQDNLELGMRPGRAGVPAMMAADARPEYADGSWRTTYDGKPKSSSRAGTATAASAPEAVATKKQDFLEADPYWDQSNIPINTYKTKEPFKGKVVSTKRIVGPEAVGETCDVVINHEGKMPYWEGQSYGVVPPGENPKKPGKPNAVRLYSIASSRYGDDMTGTNTTLCIKRATYWDPELQAEDPAKKGVCSNFLCDTKPGDEVMMTGPSGKVMLMPEENPNVDLIMVATGTGIAPYRSCLRRLFVDKTPFGEVYSGLAWLFLGVNNTDSLLYDDEWQDILKRHPNNFRVDYALSREQKNADGSPFYIQDKVKEYGDEVFDRMDKGAHIYFCGLKGMMPGIQDMLEGICAKKGIVWEDKLKEWKKAGQWHVEVY